MKHIKRHEVYRLCKNKSIEELVVLRKQLIDTAIKTGLHSYNVATDIVNARINDAYWDLKVDKFIDKLETLPKKKIIMLSNTAYLIEHKFAIDLYLGNVRRIKR